MRKWSVGVSLCLSVLLVAALATPATAATCSWTGGTSTNWNDGTNWDGGAPGNGDDVILSAGKPNDPWMYAGDYPSSGQYASFTVGAGLTVPCIGETNVVNPQSGGTAVDPHGTGVTINVSGNATVAGTWSAGATGGAECITDGNGQCNVVKGNLKFSVPSVTFTVDSVALAGYSYAPAANHDPDGDGTAVTVFAP